MIPAGSDLPHRQPVKCKRQNSIEWPEGGGYHYKTTSNPTFSFAWGISFRNTLSCPRVTGSLQQGNYLTSKLTLYIMFSFNCSALKVILDGGKSKRRYCLKVDSVTVSVFFYIWFGNQVPLWDEPACLSKSRGVIGKESHLLLNMTKAGLLHLERHSLAAIMWALTGSSLQSLLWHCWLQGSYDHK